MFNALYLLLGGLYFASKLNFEFIIYVAVIVVILGGVFGTLKYTRFPVWMLSLLSVWGLLHILGGSVQTADGVLFAYRIYPLLDLGGEFYILKYDQFVHFYLYGVVAIMAYHLLAERLAVEKYRNLIFLFAVTASLGVSSLNEIMEFFISLTMENGVGGYENTMLDMCFNFAGALLGVFFYDRFVKRSLSVADGVVRVEKVV